MDTVKVKSLRQTLLEILNKIPREERKKLEGVKFLIDPNMIKIVTGGSFLQGEYFNESKDIVFYSSVISPKNYQKVILHEIFHHFGIKHAWMDKKYK